MNETDNVNNPSHYAISDDEGFNKVRDILREEKNIYECWNCMIETMGPEQIRGYLRGNSFKYRWRYELKKGIEDLRKAQWYENKLMILEISCV